MYELLEHVRSLLEIILLLISKYSSVELPLRVGLLHTLQVYCVVMYLHNLYV